MIEGEGSFGIKVQKVKENYHCVAYFCLAQVDNEKAITKILDILALIGIVGHVCWTKNQYYQTIQVHRLEDCIKLGKFLAGYNWYGKKGIVFNIWLQGLELLRLKEHLNENGFLKVLAIKDKMREYSKRYNCAHTLKFFSERNRIGDNSPLWTEAEIQILREHYPNKNLDKMLKLLPKRNSHSIENKAFEIGIKREKNKWRLNIDEEKLLELYNSGKSCKQIGKIINASSSAIYERLRALNVKFRQPIAKRKQQC